MRRGLITVFSVSVIHFEKTITDKNLPNKNKEIMKTKKKIT